MSWQVWLRKRLLITGNHKWNAWVRDFTAWLEKPCWPWANREPAYPYEEGDFLVIGPECFTYKDDPKVVSWRGQNYYSEQQARKLFASKAKKDKAAKPAKAKKPQKDKKATKKDKKK